LNDNVVKLVVEVELLDEGFVVGVPGGGRRRLAVNAAALPGKVGLAVSDALAYAVQALGKVGLGSIEGTPIVTPPGGPRLDPSAPPGPPYATAEAVVPVSAPEVAPEVAAAPAQPVPAKPEEPEEPEEPEPEEPEEAEAKSLSKTDAERLDAVCAAVADGRVDSSSDPDNPGFYSAALVSAGIFEDIGRASGFLSRAYAAGEVGRGSRSKEGFRYYVKRPIPVRAPPKPPAPPAPAPAEAAPPRPPAPPAPPVAAPAPAPIDLPF